MAIIPYHYITVNSFHLNFRVLINDLDFSSEMTGESISYSLPINQMLVPGLNKIEIHLLPSIQSAELNEGTNLNWRFFIEVFKVDSNSENAEHTSILNLSKLNNDNEQNSILELPAILMGTFNVYEFFDTVLTDPIHHKIKHEVNDHTRQLTINAYHKIWTWIKQKEIQSILDLSQIKFKEVSSLMGMSLSEYVEEVKSYLLEIIGNSDNKCIDFDENELIVRNQGAVYYAVTPFENSPIVLYNEMEDISTYFDFYFIFTESGFLIVR